MRVCANGLRRGVIGGFNWWQPTLVTWHGANGLGGTCRSPHKHAAGFDWMLAEAGFDWMLAEAGFDWMLAEAGFGWMLAEAGCDLLGGLACSSGSP